MLVVKYFFEEPASLEVLAPDTSPDGRAPARPRSLEDFLRAPRYYRGYLTATDLDRDLTGATAVLDPQAWLEPLLGMLPQQVMRRRDARTVQVVTRDALSSGLAGDALAAGADLPAELPDLSGELRDRLPGLRSLLDLGLTVLLAEPAHHGADWAIFCAEPLADRMRSAFGEAPADTARFVIPHVKARGEHRFYFERYDLGLYERFRVG